MPQLFQHHDIIISDRSDPQARMIRHPRLRGARGRKPQHQSQELMNDPLHNRDHPCCQELADLAQLVIHASNPSALHRPFSQSTAAAAAASSSNNHHTLTFPQLIEEYLSETVNVMAATAELSTCSTKGIANAVTPVPAAEVTKKRKKKKKKRKPVVPTTTATATTTVTNTESDVASESYVSCPEMSHHETLIRPTLTLFDLMIQGYFAQKRETATLNSQPASPAATVSRSTPESAQIEAFWKRIQKESSSFEVSINSVLDAVNRIACEKCRLNVCHVLEMDEILVLESQWNHSYRRSSLNVTHPTTSACDTSKNQSLFDNEITYMRMEEGQMKHVASPQQSKSFRHNQEGSLSFYRTASDVMDKKWIWQLRGMGIGEKRIQLNHNNDSSDTSTDDHQLTQITDDSPPEYDWRRVILYDYVLGRGISASDIFSQQPNHVQKTKEQPQSQPSPKMTASETATSLEVDNASLTRIIRYAVESIVRRHNDILQECTTCMQHQYHLEELDGGSRDHHFAMAAEERTIERGIDITAFPRLQRADKECCRVMNQIPQILFDLTFSLIMAHAMVQGQSEYTPLLWRQHDWSEMYDAVMTLWDHWFTCVQVIVSEIYQYEQSLYGLIDRQGRFPHPISSPTYRDLYRALVEEKLKIAGSFMDTLREQLKADAEIPGIDPYSHGSCFERKIHTYRVYSQHCLGFDYKQPPPVVLLDEMTQDWFESVKECLHTASHPTWNEVKQEHENRGQRFCDLLFAVNNNFGVVKSLNLISTHYHEHLKDVGLQIVSCWVHERCRKITSNTPAIPDMPRHLLLGMETTGYGNDDFGCFYNSKNRAICILVVFFYRWLSDQYDAWIAELAEEELLTSISIVDAMNTSMDGATNKLIKNSKVRKKNKEKRCESTISYQTTDALAGSKTAMTSSTSHSFEMLYLPKNGHVPSDRSRAHREEDDLNTDSIHNTEKLQTQVASEASASYSIEPQVLPLRTVHLLKLYSSVKIGIYCEDTGFMDAEQFLVGRMIELWQ